MYTLVITIDHHYQKYNYKYHCVKQTEKEAFESYFQKQVKASFTNNTMAFQNKANTFLVALSTKSSPFKPLFLTLKKQSNSLQMNLSFKLANNGKLTSDECKKHLENNLYLCYSAGDHKLDFCSKKQITVTSKGHSASITTDPLVAASEKSSEKQRATLELCTD